MYKRQVYDRVRGTAYQWSYQPLVAKGGQSGWAVVGYATQPSPDGRYALTRTADENNNFTDRFALRNARTGKVVRTFSFDRPIDFDYSQVIWEDNEHVLVPLIGEGTGKTAALVRFGADGSIERASTLGREVPPLLLPVHSWNPALPAGATVSYRPSF